MTAAADYRSRRSRIAPAALALLLLLAPGCRSPSVDSAPEERDSRPMVRVTGRLTDEGVECQALRGDDGRLYTLVGDLRGFRTGDRVVVEGTIAEVSTCMQGTTIEVKRIERIS